MGISGKEREPKRTRRIDRLNALGTEGVFQYQSRCGCPPATGSKYVIESHGRMKGCMLMNRYVELPDGHRVELAPRLVPDLEDSIEKERPLYTSGSRSSLKIGPSVSFQP